MGRRWCSGYRCRNCQPPTKQCDPCRARQSKSRKLRYRLYRMRGLCGVCGKPPLPGAALCARDLALRTRWVNARRKMKVTVPNKHVSGYRCAECSHIVNRCQSCKEKRNAVRREAYKRNKLLQRCVACSTRVKPGEVRCADHMSMHREYSRKRLAK